MYKLKYVFFYCFFNLAIKLTSGFSLLNNFDIHTNKAHLKKPTNMVYDLIVIGGGSGGMAAARRAAR